MGARLKEALGDRGASWLAREVGVSPSTVGDYLAGAVPAADRALKMARALGVSLEWLIAGTGLRRGNSLALADEADWLFIPRYDVNKMMARGANPEAEEILPIRRDLLARHVSDFSNLWITRMVSGVLRSVAEPDDLILCRRVVDRYEDGRAYIISWGDGLLFRRVFVTPDGLRLTADDVGVPTVIPPDRTTEVWPVGRILGSLALRPAP